MGVMVNINRFLYHVFGVTICTFSPPGSGFSTCLDLNESDIFIPFGGVYYDSINKVSLKVGSSFVLDQNLYFESNETKSSCNPGYADLIFVDYLLSEDTDAFSIGWGRYFGGAFYRLGDSKISEGNDKYKGIEGTVSVFSYSLKIGAYDKENNNDTEYLIGVGYEF